MTHPTTLVKLERTSRYLHCQFYDDETFADSVSLNVRNRSLRGEEREITVSMPAIGAHSAPRALHRAARYQTVAELAAMLDQMSGNNIEELAAAINVWCDEDDDLWLHMEITDHWAEEYERTTG